MSTGPFPEPVVARHPAGAGGGGDPDPGAPLVVLLHGRGSSEADIVALAPHLPVGPSELHLVGAMPVYLLFGFIPTLFGFGLGLLVQALVFEPQDMAHLAVNFLSLAVPLVTVHHTLGKKMQGISVVNVLKLDAVYYAGVTLMVGFWLSMGTEPTPLANWAAFGPAIWHWCWWSRW